MGSFLILGMGIAFSADSPQKAARNSFQNTVKSGFKSGPFFVDEDGDGICDFARKKDGSGIPNGQSPEWSQRKEGKNFQNRFSHREENTWNRQSPRQNRANFKTGECDGSGPRGSAARKGNGRK